jgi:hypothetical protein
MIHDLYGFFIVSFEPLLDVHTQVSEVGGTGKYANDSGEKFG